jgi:hypothetical protein
MTDDQIYKVIQQGTQSLITMPKGSSGYYIRRVCQDGAVTFLPVQMPISCQQGTPMGDVPK